MPNWITLYLISEWLIRLIMLVYVPQRRPPGAARTWLLVIILVPWPGLLAYVFFGHIALPRSRADLHARVAQRIHQARKKWFAADSSAIVIAEPFAPVARLADGLGDFPPLPGHALVLLDNYTAAIERLVADIDAATHHVHLLYYIFAADNVGRHVSEALIKAAARGVTCRVLMDSVGSRSGLIQLAPTMRKAGVEVTEVLEVGLFRRKAARFDLRNHRKLAVIDGRIAYAGSQNIVEAQYRPKLVNEELVVRFEGPAVAAMQAIFLADRYVEVEADLTDETLFPTPPQPPAGGAIVQVLPSGPSYAQANFKQVAQCLIHAARHRVFITTPYFIPDEAFIETLQMAAARGVEVTLMVSRQSNERLVAWAQQSYYSQVLAYGVRIHLYEPAFLHAKHLSVDDQVVMIGSANLDIRSFRINNEISVIAYDAEVARKLRAIQECYLRHSTELKREVWSQRSFVRRVTHNIARLADSFL